MSIINEALKKASKGVSGAEQWKLNIPVKQNTAPRYENPISARSSSGISWKTVCIVLLLCLGAVIFSIAWHDLRRVGTEQPKQSAAIKQKTVESVENSQITDEKPVQKIHKKNKVKIPDLKLSGIMMEYPPSALVNGQFISVGDELDGVKVLEIHKDYVLFEFQGQKFKKSIY